VRVLSWNLFHGRTVPGAGRSLLDEFARALAGWAWDVALLQEVPPWWPQPLARAAGASERHALTSRNALLPLRRWAAERWPDVVKSQGGGCNAILVRGDDVVEHRALTLRRCPERRVAQGVRLASGTWVVNLHASAHSPRRAQRDLDRAIDAWAGASPLVLGGDLNLRPQRQPEPFARLRELGFGDPTAPNAFDHVLARGLRTAAAPRRLEPRVRDGLTLSDHRPVSAAFVR
jgi:endonuclease/exonuclease/phosphatase family metal-dependent hydrolase